MEYIKELLSEYYQKRKKIERTFKYQYNNSVDKKVERLTKTYSEKIKSVIDIDK
jgi:hypothetical protein